MNSLAYPWSHPILADVQRLFPPKEPLEPTWWESHLWIVPCLVLVLVLMLILVLRCKKSAIPLPRSCADIARDRLTSLRGTSDPKSMAVSIVNILCEYITMREQLPSMKYTRQELLTALKNSRRLRDEWEHLDSLLAECERILFASAATGESDDRSAISIELLARATCLMESIEAAHVSANQTMPPS